MDTFIVGIICMSIIGGIGVYIAMKYDKAQEEISRMREQHNWEVYRLNSQITAADAKVQQSHAEIEAQRLYQEQIDLKLEAIDAGRVMIHEAMRHQDNR